MLFINQDSIKKAMQKENDRCFKGVKRYNTHWHDHRLGHIRYYFGYQHRSRGPGGSVLCGT
jgi:hypothetical protein